MNYLTIKYKRAGYKMAGVSLPLSLHNYMVLYTQAKGTTKSKLLMSLIENWKSRQEEKNPADKLILEIIKRINTKRQDESDHMTFARFKEVIHKELIHKGLNEEQVGTILKGLKDL
jgi:hypothetical protein